MRKKFTAALMSILIVLLFGTTMGTTASADIRPRPTVLQPSPMPTFAPVIIMSMGDSLTEGTDPNTKATLLGAYRADMSVLLYATGQPHTWILEAKGGTKCSWWAGLIGNLLDTYHPNILLVDCGTNDTPTDNTEADYRVILQAAQSRNIQVVAALIGIPNMRTDVNRIRPYIIDWMHQTNLAIMRALADYPSVPIADMRRVPATLEWLAPDGIHLIARSNAAYALIFYQALAPSRGWVPVRGMCGLSGGEPTEPEKIPDVDYIACRSE